MFFFLLHMIHELMETSLYLSNGVYFSNFGQQTPIFGKVEISRSEHTSTNIHAKLQLTLN